MKAGVGLDARLGPGVRVALRAALAGLGVQESRRVAGLWVPSADDGSWDEWLLQARLAGLTTDVPEPGAAVLYTNGRVMDHVRYAGQPEIDGIGLVLRTKPSAMAVHDHEGILRRVDPERVVCFVKPGEATIW